VKERVHEQLENELRQASRSDTTTAIIAIVLTFILFGMSFGFASAAVDYNYSSIYDGGVLKLSVWATSTFFISLIALVVIDLFSIFALRNNSRRKARLAESLAKLYQEEGALPLSSDDIAMGYKARGNLFIVILSTLAAVGVIIPLIVFINNIVEEL